MIESWTYLTDLFLLVLSNSRPAIKQVLAAQDPSLACIAHFQGTPGISREHTGCEFVV